MDSPSQSEEKKETKEWTCEGKGFPCNAGLCGGAFCWVALFNEERDNVRTRLEKDNEP